MKFNKLDNNPNFPNIQEEMLKFWEEDKTFLKSLENKNKKVLKRKVVEVKPMNEDEAILQMELLGHDFFMYHDSETGKAAVVYRRKDRDYGLITEE